MKVNQRCRVYGRFLTEARKGSYKCREFADDLHSVCAINTGNDIMSHSPRILFMQIVMDGNYLKSTQFTSPF